MATYRGDGTAHQTWWKKGSTIVGAGVIAIAVLLAFGTVRAQHWPPDDSEACSNCHTLDADEGLDETSYINKAARTMNTILTLNGGTAPARLGCTFCHSNPVNTVMMEVLDHFGDKTSKHPLGQTFAGGDTNGEYFSTIASTTPLELDCVDCHDATLLDTVGTTQDYFSHLPPGTGARVDNPYMVKNLTVLNEYDSHCRTCHGVSAPAIKGQNVQLGAASAHRDATTGNEILENDGTPIVPRDAGTAVDTDDKCRACHDGHWSKYPNLISDGHETHKSGGGSPVSDTEILSTDCTSVCHYQGDQYNSFETKGHGKATDTKGQVMDLYCTNCHDSGAEHAGTNANYKTKYRLLYFADSTSDVSDFGSPLYSICKQCHGTKPYHKGSKQKGGTFKTGCTDCHDEHAEGVGSASNIYMMPKTAKPNGTYGTIIITKPGTEAVWYEEKLDYYSSAAGHSGEGLCDVQECHGDGTDRGFGSLANMMTLTHPVGSRDEGNNCAQCHKHEGDTSGAFRANASCVTCHGQPPVSLATQYADYPDHNEAKTPHARHARPNESGGYGYDCSECHLLEGDGASHDTTPKSYESVWFNSAKTNPSTAGYTGDPAVTPDYSTATSTCSNLYCHSSGSSTSAIGSVQWMTAPGAPDWGTTDLPCTACHNDGAGKPYPADAQGNHARHVNFGGTEYARIDCEHCHYATTTNGTTIYLAGGKHVDTTKTIFAGSTFNGVTVSFDFTQGATDTCANISCHGAYKNITWQTTSSATCTTCHGVFVGGMESTMVAKHQASTWIDPDGNTATSFELSHPAGTVDATTHKEQCAYCHANTSAAYTTGMHIDGSIQLNVSMGYLGQSGDGTGDAGCGSACHASATPYVMSDSQYYFQQISGAGFDCYTCHGNNVNGTYWPDGANSPDRLGQHDIHVSRLAAELNYGAGPAYTDAQQKMMCAYCHPNYNGTGTHFTDSHKKGSGTITGYVDALWTTINNNIEQTDAGATYTSTDGTCANIACHNEKSTGTTAAGYGWFTGNASNCMMCHTVGGGTGIADPTDGLHDNTPLPTVSGVAHDESFPTGGTCTTCHVYIPAVSNTSTHMANGTTPADGGANTTADFYVFTAYTDSAAACSGAPVNANCHDGAGDAGTWARVWSTTAYNSDGTECVNCHGGVTGEVWTFGSGAHSTTDGNVEHNYDWDGATASEVIGSHNADTAETDRCNLCHVYQFTGYSSNGTGSIGWVANATNTSTYHGDGSLEMNSNSTVKYNSTGYGCDLQACHDAGTSAVSHRLEDSRWNLQLIVGPEAKCFACHGNETNATYWPDGVPGTTPDRLGEHDIHISRLAAELGYAGPNYTDAEQKTMCAYCHPNPGGAAFSANHPNGTGNVTGYVDFLWTTIGAAESTDTDATLVTGDMTCANFDCHNRQVTPASYGWYAAGTSACTMCHAVGGTGIADPTDGLHDNTPLPTVSGVAHDESFPTGGTCTTCHVYIPAVSNTSTHMANGITPADGGANTTADFYVFTAYTDSSAACSGAPVNANCHDGVGDAGTWPRVWSTTAYNSDGTECANCHGGVTGEVWTFGLGAHSTTDGNVEHNYSWDGDGASSEVIGNHLGDIGETDRCSLCHVYQFTGYTTNGTGGIGWVANASSTSTYHGDGSISMNSNATVKYNSTGYGCDLQTCHDAGTSAVSHRLEDSRWGLRLIVGPEGGCYSCHGNGTNSTYWPDGAATPDRLGEHDIHITRLAAELNYGAGPTYTDAQQKTMCAYCHPNPAGGTFTALHNKGTRDVTGYVDFLWTTIGAAESTDANATLVTGDMTCANFDCHNRQVTPASYGWYAAGTSACTMCHVVGGTGIADPTDGLHDNTPLPTVSGVAHDESFPTGGTCTTCHVYIPAVSNTSTHMANGTTPADGGANTTADFYVFTAYTDSSAACSGAPVNANCHDGAGDAGTWARVWSTTAYNSDGTECVNCHGGVTGEVWTMGSGAHSTTDGNVEHNYSWDTDGTSSEVIGNHSADTSQFDRCELCHVYQYGVYSTNATDTHIGWVTNASNTSTYHGDGSLEMNSHTLVRYNSANYGCDSGACHGTGATNYKLEDSRWAVNLLAGPGPNCGMCHGTSTGTASFWPDAAASPDRTGEHVIHITRLATKLGYAGTTYTEAQQLTMCAYCHENPTGANFPVIHKNGTGNVTGYVDFLWTTIGAAESTDTDATLVTASSTCANFDCHNRQATPASYGWYAAGTSACTMCHAVGGTGISQPVDGLHDSSPLPTVSGVAHDESFPTGGTCTTCHVYLPAFSAGSTHMANGTTPADGGANTTADFYVFTAYTDSSAACSGAPVNANCHDGVGDAGTWLRVWSTTAYNSDGTECANCHGGVTGEVWTFGLGAHSTTDGNVEHNYDWDGATASEVIGSHSQDNDETDRCNLCHVYQFTGYSSNGTGSIGWVANASNTSTYHGDGSIEMNSHSTVRYNSTSYGCDSGSCHDTGTSAVSHLLEDSRWGIVLLSGPVADCFTCHGNNLNATYWPDGVPGTTPDRLGEHDIHISRLAAELGYAGPNYTDAEQKTMCAYCHQDPAGANFAKLHNNGTRNVTGYVDFLWTTIGAAESTDANATLVTGDMTCANFDCHNRQVTPASYGWYAAGTSACTMCHAVGGTGIADPTDGLHDNTPLPTVSGVAHDESFPTGGTCTTCHVYIPAVSNTSTHMANGTTPADGGANTTADFYVFTAYTDSAAACSGAPVNANCHDGAGDAGTWARVWSTTAYNSDGTECVNCHGGVTGEVWTFGSGAHSTTDGNVEHNYSWDTDGTSSEVIGNHSADTSQFDRCELCHVYQYGVYSTNATDTHIGWVTNASNTSTYHGDGSLEMNSHTLVRYNSANYGCDSGACHGTGATNYKLEDSRWAVNLLAGPGPNCGMCHGTATGTPSFWPDQVASPDRTGEHVIHITRLATKLGYAGTTYTEAQQLTMCAYCHENPTGANFPVIHKNGTGNVTGYVDFLWTTIGAAESTDTDATLVTASSTCANFDCHNQQATPASYGWYAAGTSACTMCHAVGGTGISQPVDGLHDNTPLPTVSGVAHDESFPTGGTCTTCHVYLPAFSAGSAHMANGITPADGGANTTADFYVFTAYTDSSAACSGAPVNANCHDGVGDAGTWLRVWSTTAYNSDGTECANCHGGVTGEVWTFGLGAHGTTDGNVEHNYSWDGDGASSEVIGNHSADTAETDRCDLCHVYQFTGYTSNGTGSIGWVANASNTSTYHGDGSLEMNSNSTVKYNSTSYGCDIQSCHDAGTSAVSHRLEDSRWNLQLISGPTAGCDVCHGNSTNVTYWPDGAATPDRLGEHDIHISRLATKLGYAGPNYTDAQQKTMCAYCHPNPGGANFGGIHNNGTRNVTGYVDFLWTTIGAAESTDTDATLVTASSTCANFDCHNQQATPASYGWYAAGTSACTMCHAVGGTGISQPVDGLHDSSPLPTVSGVAHDESFPTGGTCTTCHVYLPAFSAGSTHMANGTTPADGGANTTADFYVFTAYTDSSAACSGAPVNANCHDGVGDAGTWLRVWSTTAYNSDGTECANCHGGVTGEVWTFGLGAHGTTDGNVEHNYSWDGDGTSSEVIGSHSADTAETDRCNLCHVYQFTGYTSNGTGSIGWVANASNTSTYHGDGSLEMNSNSTVKYNSTSYGCDIQSCHDAGTSAVSHRLEDSRWNLQLIVGPEAKCFTCHGSIGNATYWPDGVPGTTPDRLGEHDIHISRLAAELNYGAGPTYTDAQQKTMCAYCHPNPGGAAFTANHPNGTRNVTGYVDFLWTTIGAAESTDANATLVTGDMTCANFDCHNRQVTPASYGWYAAGTSACTMCHAVGGTGIADPTDGLHDNTPLPTVSGVAHDESFPTGGTCTTCHVYIPAVSNTSTHMANGTTPADGGANTTADFYVFTAYTDSAAACSGAPVNANCHDGAGDAGTWARVWSTTAYNSDGTECVNCHGGVTGEVWTFGSGAHSTTDGNVEHNYSWDTDGTSSEVIGNHSADTSQFDRCELCHVYQYRRLQHERHRYAHRLGDERVEHQHVSR